MASAHACPVCRRPSAPHRENHSFPFCSERCRLIDLGKWLGEQYRVPAGPPGDGAGGSSDPGDDPEH